MPRRAIPIHDGQLYHVYNISSDGEPTFTHKYHYQKAVEGLWYYRYHQPPIRLAYFKNLSQQKKDQYLPQLQACPLLVDIVAYAIMPDHFHLITLQHIEGGTSRFLANFQNSYTRYFNAHKDKTGPRFDTQFTALPLQSDYDALQLTNYIHLKALHTNRVTTIDELFGYDWSSLSEYTGAKPEHLRFCNRDPIIHQIAMPYADVLRSAHQQDLAPTITPYFRDIHTDLI